MDTLFMFNEQNPWRSGKLVDIKGYIQRDSFYEIGQWINDPDIIILTGPRQSGKTTILSKIIEDLLKNKVSPSQIFYFNLDSREIQELIRSPTDILKFVRDRSNEDERIFLFMDEAQRIENAGLFMKTIYDLKKDIKIFVSGSSSLELRAKIKEHLTGRKKDFLVSPFSFNEFLRSKAVDIPSLKDNAIDELRQYQRIYGNTLNDVLIEFSRFGGYPKAVLKSPEEKKLWEIDELYKDYVKKDIQDFLNIEDPVSFNKLVAITAHQIGNLVNKVELSSSIGVSRQTTEKYLMALEETYIIKLLLPYSSNKRKELSKMPKVYFRDIGLRNFAVKNFDAPDIRGDSGAIIENIVMQEFLKKSFSNWEINYWRTQSQAEVDFILTRGEKIIPVEVKFSNLKTQTVSRSFRNFIEDYHPSFGIILTKDFIGDIEIQRTKVSFIPVSFWLLNSFQIIGNF